MKRIICLIALTQLICIPALARVFYVPNDYSTIQAAINATVNGDTVLVSQGTYLEHFRFNGKAILLKSQSGPDETIIASAEDFNPIIRFENNETSQSILDGFTISNSSGAPAINMINAGPTIIRNRFTGNRNSRSDGGAIDAVNGPPMSIIDNVFENNSSSYGTGGAIRTYGIDLIVTGNIFRANDARTDAGAIHLRASDNSEVHHNLFFENHCGNVAGAIVFSECGGGAFYNNTMVENSTDFASHGGGLVVWMSNNINIYNNIITNNVGIGIYNYSSQNCQLTYNDVWGNQTNYSGITPGEGSISLDPLFVGGSPYDFHVTGQSPCIDSGDPVSPNDPDGTRSDMGAYFFNQRIQGMAFAISNVYGSPGHIIDVPLLAMGFEGQPIGGLEFHISFDPSCLEYDSINTELLPGADINITGNEIHLIWEDFATPLLLSDSLALLSLRFNVLGPIDSACAITWLSGNLAVDPLGEPYANTNYNPGSVTVAILRQICGHIVYYDTINSIPGVNLALSGGMVRTGIANQNGMFCFDNLVSGNYLLTPYSNINDPGVTVADIIKIRRHIIHLEAFDSPYKYVAADVNNCGSVTVADAVKIRRYLAGLEALPSGNWTFIDSTYAINDTNWPQAPHAVQATLSDQDILDIGFIGVRMGDVDASWPNLDLFSMLADTVNLEQNNVSGMPGDTISISVSGRGIANIAGIEMHLNYPAEALTFIDINSTALEGTTFNGGNGSIHFIWEDIFNPVTIDNGDEILSIRFRILENAPELMTISFTGVHVADEVGDELHIITGDGHVRRGPTGTGENDGSLPYNFILSQNHPNPFNPTTTIEYGLPNASQVNLDIYDLLGRKITTLIDKYQAAGFYQVVWNAADVSSGIYLYKINAGSLTINRKMLLLK
jgi:parallel beta-helix repeat protein